MSEGRCRSRQEEGHAASSWKRRMSRSELSLPFTMGPENDVCPSSSGHWDMNFPLSIWCYGFLLLTFSHHKTRICTFSLERLSLVWLETPTPFHASSGPYLLSLLLFFFFLFTIHNMDSPSKTCKRQKGEILFIPSSHSWKSPGIHF